MFGLQLQKTTKNDHEQEFAAAISTYQIMFHDPTMTQLISGLSGYPTWNQTPAYIRKDLPSMTCLAVWSSTSDPFGRTTRVS